MFSIFSLAKHDNVADGRSFRFWRKKAVSLAIKGGSCILFIGPFAMPHWAEAQESADETGEKILPNIVVSEKAEPLAIPRPYAGGQVATGARIGLLGNQDVMDTPFNVTGYTSALLQNQQTRTIADAMANDPSVRFTTSNGHVYENFRIRGFDSNQSDVAVNGMFGLAPAGHVPVEFLERVEVLKGPNALFSGMPPGGGVGGVINLVPKRAGEIPVTQGTVAYQSVGQYGASFDLGRRLGDAKAWGVRVNGLYGDGKTLLDGQTRKRQFLSAAVDYRGRALFAAFDAYHVRTDFEGGTPAMFWFGTTDIPRAPDPRKNQFDSGHGTLESNAAIARAEYEFDSDFSAFASIGVMHHDYQGFINGSHVRNIDAQGNSPASMTVIQHGKDSNVAAEAGLRARLNTGPVSHEFVLQASRLDQESSSNFNRSAPFRTNIYHPAHSVMPRLPASMPKTSETTLSSLALVDTMSFADDRIRLILGARHQTVKTSNFNVAGAVTASYDKSVVTPAAAIVVKPWGPAMSIYANYVEGLSQGNSVTDTAATNYGHVFAPYQTRQKEIGVKWNAGSFTNTASLFEINKPMMIVTGSPSNPTYSDGGEKRVRGLEWNIFGEFARHVRLLGGVTYSRGIQTKTAYGQHDGRIAVGVPRWQGNLGAEWDVPGIAGLTLSVRTIATSAQYLDSANTQRIPGWSRFDLGARYTVRGGNGRKIVYRVNADNVFDRHYYSGSFSDNAPIATLGPARTLTASVTVDF